MNTKSKISKVMIYSLFAMMCTGCAAINNFSLSDLEKIKQFARNGQCGAADDVVHSSTGFSLIQKYTLQGGIYYECYHDQESALQYLNIAAMYGEIDAINSLIRLRKAVPERITSDSAQSISDIAANIFSSNHNNVIADGKTSY